MVKTTLLFVLLFSGALAKAQAVRQPVGVVYTRLTAYSNQFSDAFSFAANQAALAGAKKFSAGVYSERRFLLQALSSYAAASVLPTASGNFGLSGHYFGEQAYNESALGLAYARNLGQKLALGVQFNYHSLKAASYGAASTVNFDVGAIYRVSGRLNTGVHVYNPASSGWGTDGLERLPTTYTVGLGYDVSPQVFVGLEAEKSTQQPVGINAGLQYLFTERLLARVGVRTATETYLLGVGIKLSGLRLDATAAIHPYLGVTPGLLLLYAPTK